MPRDVLRLAATINEAGWDVYKQRCQARIDLFERGLVDPSAERQAKTPDDFLRGQISGLQWALTWPSLMVAQYAHQADDAREDAREQLVLDARTKVGPTFPFAIS